MEMTWASAGKATLAGGAVAGAGLAPVPRGPAGGLATKVAPANGVVAAPRPGRKSPRLVASGRFASGRRGCAFAAPGRSPVFAGGLEGNWMKPTLSPTLGPGGGGGGAGGAGGGSTTGCAGGAAGSATGATAAGVVAGFARAGVATITGSTATGSGTAGGGAISGGGDSAGAVVGGRLGGGGAGGGAGGVGGGGLGAASSGWARRICCSRYSAVILSSELEATRAPVMPNSLALARTVLLSRPSLFEMS